MRIIEYVAQDYILKKKRKKLDKRSRKYYLVDYKDINIFRVWNLASYRVKRVIYIDFDETRLIITTISNIDYQMAEATGDNVFDVGSNKDYLYLLSNSPNAPIIDENIQKILTLRDLGDVKVKFNENVGDNDIRKLISGSEIYSNLSEDIIYS